MTKPLDDRVSEIVSQSGYPLEYKVATMLEGIVTDIQTHTSFIDVETEKEREIDIKAFIECEVLPETTIHLIIECKNIPGNLWVFKKLPFYFMPTSAIKKMTDLTFLNRYDQYFSKVLEDKTKTLNFCKNINVYNDYLESILDENKSNKKTDNLFEANIKLIKSAFYEMNDLKIMHEEIYDDYKENYESLSLYVNRTKGLISIIIPIIFFSGYMYEAYYDEDDKLITKPIEKAKLITGVHNKKYPGRYCVEVISEKYIDKYCDELLNDLNYIVTLIKKHYNEDYLLQLKSLLNLK